MVERKEEQRGKVRPGNVRLFFEKFKLVLKAQKGMKGELRFDEMCIEWLIVDARSPVLRKSFRIEQFNPHCILPITADLFAPIVLSTSFIKGGSSTSSSARLLKFNKGRIADSREKLCLSSSL